MKTRVDWKKVNKIQKLINDKKLTVTEVSAIVGIHRKQVYRFLDYAKRENYPQQ